jgi:secreted trypsin-like serine protease
MFRMLVCIVAIVINWPIGALAQSADTPPNTVDHYGEIADPSVWPISAVGVVTVALFSRVHYCTGTLVAPKLVLTAAHCLFDNDLIVKSGSVRFLAGLNKGVPTKDFRQDRRRRKPSLTIGQLSYSTRLFQ